MKVLLDACVWGGAAPALATAGHDVEWAGSWPQDPGDAEILAIAHQQGRVLVTLDKDFGELVVVHGFPHSGIVRLVGFPARQQAPACAQVLELHGDALARAAVITVEPHRIRIRTPGE